jgi:hypothetical protein
MDIQFLDPIPAALTAKTSDKSARLGALRTAELVQKRPQNRMF